MILLKTPRSDHLGALLPSHTPEIISSADHAIRQASILRSLRNMVYKYSKSCISMSSWNQGYDAQDQVIVIWYTEARVYLHTKP